MRDDVAEARAAAPGPCDKRDRSVGRSPASTDGGAGRFRSGHSGFDIGANHSGR